MRVLVANDIHGISLEVSDLLRALQVDQMLSPWDEGACPIPDEQAAVAVFLQNGGIQAYVKRIAETAAGEPVVMIGFSVGATSVWHYLATQECHPDSKAILFYGSRIRDALDLSPRCQTSLIFAEHEASFDPSSLMSRVDHPLIKCGLVHGAAHGFMNPRHARYDAALAQKQISAIRQMLLLPAS